MRGDVEAAWSLRRAEIRRRNPPYPYAVRVAACADYLLGKPLKEIALRHGIAEPALVIHWIRQRKCFKLRNRTLP